MFDVYYTKKKDAYLLEARSTGDKFYVTIRKTLGYPKKAKRPYKGTVWLIKNGKFILLKMSDSSSRQLYSAIMDRLTQFIIRQEDIKASIKEQEEEQYSLLEQNLDDISY
jgi:hypothetical protein